MTSRPCDDWIRRTGGLFFALAALFLNAAPAHAERTCIDDVLCLTATGRDANRIIEFTIENRAARPIVATLAFPIFENMKSNLPIPFKALIPAKSANRDLVILVRNRERRYRWDVAAKWEEAPGPHPSPAVNQ